MEVKAALNAVPGIRIAVGVAAFAIGTAATLATVTGILDRRTEAAHGREARTYAGIVEVVARQRWLLAPSRRARTSEADIAALSRSGQGLLDDLRARSGGADTDGAAALTVSYRMATRHAVSAVGGRARAGQVETARQARAELAAIQANAAATLRQRQDTGVRGSGLSLLDLAQTLATLIVGLATLLGAVLVLRGGRAPRSRARDAELVRLEVEARTDNLTGLGNHRAFHHDLSLEVMRRAQSGSVFALMALDLDGLKQINDSQGHQAGDRYIKRVSDIARTTTGREGTVYRTGGDEFMILLPGSRNWNALALANKIDRLTREAIGKRALSIGLTESTGTEARHLLIHQADVALYEAKRTKLNALTYHPGLTSAGEAQDKTPSHHQRTLAAALARAVDAKDAGTRSHSETVAELAVAIGKSLRIDGEGLERLRLAGLLHDVGKIGVSDAILQKPAALGLEERDEMKGARDDRARDPALCRAVHRGRVDPAPPRAVRRHRLPARPAGGSDSARVADHRGRGRVRGDDWDASLSRALDGRSRARGVERECGYAVRRPLRRRAHGGAGRRSRRNDCGNLRPGARGSSPACRNHGAGVGARPLVAATSSSSGA
ncbi:MAG: diguanylate cyclase [Gaiellaceae bacterium]